jgi:TRAP-type transport system periplasmic protein
MFSKLSAAALALAVVFPVAAGAAESAAKPVTLRFNFTGPSTSTNYVHGMLPWAQDVMKASDGTLDIKFFFGSSLATMGNTWDRLRSGVIDIGMSVPTIYHGMFPNTSVADLPFVVNDIIPGSIALWNLYADGMLGKEYDEVHPLAFFLFPPTNLHTRQPIERLADLNGLKIAVQGAVDANIMEHLGGTPITLTTQENYSALQRGVVDGAEMGWGGVVQYKLEEVTHYHLDVGYSTPSAFILMGKAAYEHLPAKAKAAVDKYSGEAFSRRMAETFTHTAVQQESYVSKLPGQHMFKLDPAERAHWIKVTQPIIDAWVKSRPNGAAILAKFREELKKAGDR